MQHFKTTFMSPRSIAGVPSGRELPGYPITAHNLYAFACKQQTNKQTNMLAVWRYTSDKPKTKNQSRYISVENHELTSYSNGATSEP